MKPGATLGLSHGFLLGVMKNDGVDFRRDINVVLVAPKVCVCVEGGGEGEIGLDVVDGWGNVAGRFGWAGQFGRGGEGGTVGRAGQGGRVGGGRAGVGCL